MGALCYAYATADPLLDLAIPLDDACEAGSKDCDLSLLQVRGQLKLAEELAADEGDETSPAEEAKKEAKKEKKEQKKEAREEKKKEKKEKKEAKKEAKEVKKGK